MGPSFDISITKHLLSLPHVLSLALLLHTPTAKGTTRVLTAGPAAAPSASHRQYTAAAASGVMLFRFSFYCEDSPFTALHILFLSDQILHYLCYDYCSDYLSESPMRLGEYL